MCSSEFLPHATTEYLEVADEHIRAAGLCDTLIGDDCNENRMCAESVPDELCLDESGLGFLNKQGLET